MRRILAVAGLVMVLMAASCSAGSYQSGEKEKSDRAAVAPDWNQLRQEAGEELEADYRRGQVTEREYTRKRAILLLEDLYQDIATSQRDDHLSSLLKIAGESGLDVSKLVLYRHDGIVSFSADAEDRGKSISSIDEHVQLNDGGLLAQRAEITSEGKRHPPLDRPGELGMVRPVLNQKACHGCHASDQRVLGGLYVFVSVE